MRIGQSKIEEAVLDAEWLRDDESRKSAKRGFMECVIVCLNFQFKGPGIGFVSTEANEAAQRLLVRL